MVSSSLSWAVIIITHDIPGGVLGDFSLAHGVVTVKLDLFQLRHVIIGTHRSSWVMSGRSLVLRLDQVECRSVRSIVAGDC